MSRDMLLSVHDLSIRFQDSTANLVDGLSFEIAAGETLALVGESGCGKSLTALALMGLLPPAPQVRNEGRATFQGQDHFSRSPADWRRVRGHQMAMIFQEPMTALNPAIRIGEQIAESVRRHQGLGQDAAAARAVEMLDRVRIPGAARRSQDYPHQLSGGMRQRAMIAMALANDPPLLIADEPTTALDVTIQAQILDLIRDLQADSGTALLLITHDLGVVAEMADRVAVMYAGRIVEAGPVAAIFEDPQHPYTIGLISALPTLGGPTERLVAIPGSVPLPTAMPEGCRFGPRCPFVGPDCADVPISQPMGNDHSVACWRAPLTEAPIPMAAIT